MAVGVLFFLQGLAFSSWASRIPSVQERLHLSETELGLVLFALPFGLMVSLPFAAWLITRFGSRKVVFLASIAYLFILIFIGFSTTISKLTVALFAFGLFGNMVNIAVNTQAVNVEALYNKAIMASFHGLWSLAGFCGAALGTLMSGLEIAPSYHFLIIALFSILILTIYSRNTVQSDIGGATDKKFVLPDKSLLHLGLIAFFSLICEGAMFDWSGVYFKKVVMAKDNWIGMGYTVFMCTMAGGRFFADRLVTNFGLKRILQVNGVLTAFGLLLAVVFPTLTFALVGFFLVGFGVSSIVPLIYSAAGKSKKVSPGIAIATVSTIGFVGFLIGPPLIGIIAGAFNLRVSFILIAAMSLCVTLLSAFIKED
ncbi:MAG: MFS transporter [Sphingobacteriaceae bacterium]|nr:MFS transporter [Sphingobacteriaceae bacterium]